MFSSPSELPLRPLTEAQEGLWYAQRLDPLNPIFNTGHCTHIHSALDTALFAQAINLTLTEADALTLRMVDTPDGPAQYLRPQEPIQLEIVDLSAHPDGAEQAQTQLMADLRTPLDPTIAPLARHILFVLGPKHHLWYQRIHHLAADGYGMALIETRVVKLYKALLNGHEDHGHKLESFALLQDDDQSYRESERRSKDRQFWLDTLNDAEPAQSLSESQALSDHHFLLARRAVKPELTASLQALAQSNDISWPDILTGLTAAYVRRHTRQDECTVGVPWMGRLGHISARIVSTVMNVAPLRLKIDESQPLNQYLIQVSKALRQARRHGRYRSEQLRRDLGLLGGMRRLHGPIINVLPFDAPYEQAGLTASQTVLCAGPVEDLNFTFRAQPDASGLRLEVEANPRLYTQEQIQTHLTRLEQFLLRALQADTLSAVPTLTDAEHHHWIETVNQTAHPVPETTLWALIHVQLQAHPEQSGLEFEGKKLSYAQIDEQTANLAAQLRLAGVQTGDIVAVALPRSLELVLSLLAIHRAGAAYLPLDLDQPADRLNTILQAAQPRLLVGQPDCTLNATLLVPQPEQACSADAWTAAGPHDPSYLIYTSGSTGAPKGVLVNHDAIVNRLVWMQTHYGIGTGDRILQKTPATFDVSVWEFFLPFLSGATLVVAPPQAHRDPAHIARLMREQSITVLHFVPSMLSAFLDEPEARGLAPRLVFCSGEELSATTRDRFHCLLNAELHNLYGPTEAAVDVSYWPASREDKSQPVPIGFPVWNTALYILDEQLQPVPPGVAGHLYLAGRQLAQGYWGRPDLTEERFVPDPYALHGDRMYATGDVARWRDDGAVIFLGRSDHQIKLRGQRIELGEIEALLARHPDVAHVAVIAREDIPGQMAIVAYWVPQAGSQCTDNTLAAYVGEHLPSYMVPSAWISLDALPVTANGKLDRKALPVPALQARSAGLPLEGATQHQIAAAFATVLESSDAFYADDDFFALGGHSLLAAKLALLLREARSQAVSIGTIFEYPTIARLAKHLDQAGSTTADGFGPIITLRPGQSDQPALFVIHPAGGLSWCYGALARHLPPGRAVYGLQASVLSDASLGLDSSLDAMAKVYVDRIEHVQPQGPYHLAGWSVGGIIAQAMAVELRRRGQLVGMLSLLDAYPSDAWRNEPAPEPNAIYKALLHIAGHDPDSLPDVSLTRKGVVDFLKRSAHPLAELPDTRLDSVFQVVENNNRLVRLYEHHVYDGPMLYFRAALDHAGTQLHPNLWQPYAEQLDVHDIACLHAHLTGTEAVAVMAPLMDSAMAFAEQAQAQPELDV
ncbi:non-ribosomal peptide synthetase [Alcaligenes faecalis]|uniref:Non-ribosomal peptide synthetase n=1 Tax=Alcaligenes faecalis TaxID=511 RepID=A0AB33CP66_ALCFA|nr:non-ribosomal peptide synthetase [Alcaligenes faecalis]ASR88226.1 non-ribosomal peptide synthetase [Alcaligenes faecalis]